MSVSQPRAAAPAKARGLVCRGNHQPGFPAPAFSWQLGVMPVLPADQLRAIISALFERAGTPVDLADLVAISLVASDLRGLESHGAMRVLRYLTRIRDGSLHPAARPRVLRREGTTAAVDGGWGFGQVAAHFATGLAKEIGQAQGSAVVAVHRAHHVGRIGEYAESLAAAGLVGMVLTAGGERGGAVAPHGSRQRLLGTNPIAVAIPTPAPHPPLVLDFATSAIPEGRVAVARANGTALPPGCLVDSAGRPTNDPGEFYAGGALLPFGAHKGSALMLMIEILATTLAGSAPISAPDYQMGNPTLILAWSVERFAASGDYRRLVGDLLDRIKASPPAVGFTEVLLPGELEARNLAARTAKGIPLSDGTWRELCAAATAAGITPPKT